MSLLGLLEAHLPGTRWRLLVIMLLWGLCGAVVVPLTNAAFDVEAWSGVWWGLLVLTIIALGALLWASHRATQAAVAATEGALQALWRAAGERLLSAELRAIEPRVGLAERLAADLSLIGQAAQPAVFTVQSAASLLATTVIVALVAPGALALWAFALGGVGWVVRPDIRESQALGAAVAGRRARMGEAVNDLLGGLLQTRLHSETGEAVAGEVLARAAEWRDENARADVQNVRASTRGLLALFLLGYLPVLAGPSTLLSLDDGQSAIMILMLGLGFGPVLGLLFNGPIVLQAAGAATRVQEALDALGPAEESLSPPSEAPVWSEITLRGAGYGYEGGFQVGPLDLSFHPGELVFVTGGNGSGKTTLMKLLLGLYPCQRGELRWDGRRVFSEDRLQYRQLFTAVFNDVYLFPRLYGVNAPSEAVHAALDRLGLTDIVRYQGGRFAPLELSTGQRKRLAMVVALLEDRPICVFDEWTANLDPETSRFYYDTLLPELRRRGKTVIAVSHDDRTFDRADRILRLERGRLVASAP